jgi:hypothetical protein
MFQCSERKRKVVSPSTRRQLFGRGARLFPTTVFIEVADVKTYLTEVQNRAKTGCKNIALLYPIAKKVLAKVDQDDRNKNNVQERYVCISSRHAGQEGSGVRFNWEFGGRMVRASFESSRSVSQL